MITLLLAAAAVATARPILITVDDLPIAATELHVDPKERDRITQGLLDALKKHHVKAIVFVTGKRGLVEGDSRLLDAWVAAGHELGNHTDSHLHLTSTPVADWIADTEKERVALEKRGTAPRFFRYPFLEEGATADARDAVREYLRSSKQTPVTVTIDDQDWSFEKPFVLARRAKKTAELARITEDYRAALRLAVTSQEERGDDLLGRAAPQILLLHANEVGAHEWDGLFTWLESTGHRFASADDVLADPAVAEPSSYVGPYGFGLWDRRIAVERDAKAVKDVTALVQKQAAAWNAGDLAAFCSVYAPDASFVSPSGVTHGRDAVLERYRKKYPTKDAMGTLTLEPIETRSIAGTFIDDFENARPSRPEAVVMVATWRLEYPSKPAATGSTQLVFTHRVGQDPPWEIASDASM